MKNFLSLLIVLLMVSTLTGCGGLDILQPDSSNRVAATGEHIYPDDEGYAEGHLDDIMHTCFFDFTVHGAYLCEEFEGYVPAEGKDLLVATVSVKNTHQTRITMFDTDFQVQWNDEAETAFDVPVTYYIDITETLHEDVLPYEYELKVNNSRTGLMIFEVPEGELDFSISYLEYFEDGTTGDVFFVYFSAEQE